MIVYKVLCRMPNKRLGSYNCCITNNTPTFTKFGQYYKSRGITEPKVSGTPLFAWTSQVEAKNRCSEDFFEVWECEATGVAVMPYLHSTDMFSWYGPLAATGTQLRHQWSGWKRQLHQSGSGVALCENLRLIKKV